MNKKSLTSKLINAPYLLWSVLFILAPMVMVVYYALPDRSGNLTWDNITALTAYKETFGRSIWYAVWQRSSACFYRIRLPISCRVPVFQTTNFNDAYHAADVDELFNPYLQLELRFWPTRVY